VLTRLSRLAGCLSDESGPVKLAIVGAAVNAVGGLGKLLGKGLFSASKLAVTKPLQTAGVVGGSAMAGMGAKKAFETAGEEMSPQGFANRMGYGG